MANSEGTILGHPKGLFVLFFTEMWERFCYYGMRALLVLYLVNFYKWSQADASQVYKWYVSLVYVTPLLGGYLADRVLGNRWAIIIGAIMMAAGEFMIAAPANTLSYIGLGSLPDITLFYAGLGSLIMGNGFFKPNMSVQVGRLYPQNDPRRDGAYTIFYMGINLGAFIAPLVTGAFMDTPALGFKWGFAAAGVGMLFSLVVYLFGLPWIKELPEDAIYEAPDSQGSDKSDKSAEHVMSEDQASGTPSVLPNLARMSVALMIALGVVLFVVAPLLAGFGVINWDNAVSMCIAGASAFFGAWILSQLGMAVRDRVLAIFALFVFVVFFWSAFEQAGNAMNVWADQTTNRHLTEAPPTPDLYPSAPVDIEQTGLWNAIKEAFAKPFQINPVLTTSFQSINPLAIFLLAPFFAWLWVYLAKKKIDISIAGKMSIGVFMQGVAFALMVWAATYENQPSTATLAKLPAGMEAKGDELFFYDVPDLGDTEALKKYVDGDMSETKEVIAHGGRLSFNAGTLHIDGVLDQNHRDRIFRATAPKAFVREVWDMAERAAEADKAAKDRGEDKFSLKVPFPQMPPGFEPRYLNGFKPGELTFDAETNTFTVGAELANRNFKQILVAGADPEFRAAMNDLYLQSSKFRVSSMWLLWFYVLCTIGELCLSPVGLSMVSKLAPRRFATMLMGLWLLTSFFGNFCAGLAGEHWESLQPESYFTYITIVMLAAALVCFLLVKKITAMMHGVK